MEEKPIMQTDEKQPPQQRLLLLPIPALASKISFRLPLALLLLWSLRLIFLFSPVLPHLRNSSIALPVSIFSLPLQASSSVWQQVCRPSALGLAASLLLFTSFSFLLLHSTPSLPRLVMLPSKPSRLLLPLPVSRRLPSSHPYALLLLVFLTHLVFLSRLNSCLCLPPLCRDLSHRISRLLLVSRLSCFLQNVRLPVHLIFFLAPHVLLLPLLHRLFHLHVLLFHRLVLLVCPLLPVVSRLSSLLYCVLSRIMSDCPFPLFLRRPRPLRLSDAIACRLHRRFPRRGLRHCVSLLVLFFCGLYSPSTSSSPFPLDAFTPWSLFLISTIPSFSRLPFSFPAEAAISLPPNSSWVCRISETWQRCGDVYANAATGQKGGICRTNYCCAKYAVSPDNLFGDVCTNNAKDCGSHKPDYSYGRCSREDMCHKCAKYAQCNYDNTTNGGVWCHCPPPGVGDGITCKVDPCANNPCTNGLCIPSPSSPNGYTCKCLPGFVSVTDQQGQFVRCVDLCNSGVCGQGVLACYNGQNSYMCACAYGYINVKLNGKEECVKPDLCQVNPCGPPSAVQSCRTTSSSSYTCTCATDFTLASVNGKQYCVRKQ